MVGTSKVALNQLFESYNSMLLLIDSTHRGEHGSALFFLICHRRCAQHVVNGLTLHRCVRQQRVSDQSHFGSHVPTGHNTLGR